MTFDPIGDFLSDYARRERAVEQAVERHSAAQYRYAVRYSKLERLRRTLDENGLGDRFEQIAADDLAELRIFEDAEAAEWRAYQRAKAKLADADHAMRDMGSESLVRVEHSDLAGIPRGYVKRLIITIAGASLEMKRLEDPLSGLYARFAVALAERVADFDAGETDAFVQVLYETAVQRMCDELDLPLDTVPNLVPQA